jgi:hypothetical protein
MKWYKHQEDLIRMNPHKRGVGFGCGCGKTRTILQLAKNKGGSVLVVAPKTQVLDRTWERESEASGISVPLAVMSKEQFKKGAPRADVLVLDESHCFMGVTPATRYRNKVEVPRASQLFEKTLEWVRENKPKHIYMASATPFPQPMALWASAQVFGADWDYFAFRRKFYAYVPVIGRGVWLPRRDKQHEALLVGLAQKFWTFGRLEDFFDVPDQVFKDLTVGMEPAQKRALKGLPLLYPEPLALVGKTHQLEQGVTEEGMVDEAKTEQLLDLAKEFPKLLVFAKYTAQIDHIASTLAKKTKAKVLVLDGRTEDRRAVLEAAEAPGRAVVVAQSQVSTGYELPSFRCTAFASMSYSFVDYEQALGRTQRANAISKNVYVHLLAGEVDREVLRCVRGKQDFNEALYIKNREA